MAIRLLRYNFELVYVPGKDQMAADTLSRDPTEEKISTVDIDANIKVDSVIATTEENEKRLIEAINEDAVLHQVKHYVSKGWPQHKKALSAEVKPYWPYRSELYIQKDILFLGNRLVIPTKLRTEFLELTHKAHQGVVSCKKLAQNAMFWPGISKDVEGFVLACKICQLYARSNQKEPLSPHQVPDYPWEKIGIDFKSLKAEYFIVVL